MRKAENKAQQLASKQSNQSVNHFNKLSTCWLLPVDDDISWHLPIENSINNK
jgi:hypothetical protein